MPYHLNRAMDNGLTQPQAAEVITHLAFYVRLAQRIFGAAGCQGCIR
jgi:alkylhydroperoxidase/carboxymuconolactone decarboxylase family protein YurZ